MEYAEMLKVKFAYSTNGHSIVEHDYTSGTERVLDKFPSPNELLTRTLANDGIVGNVQMQVALTPTSKTDKPLRYYQEIAVNKTIGEIVIMNSWNLESWAFSLLERLRDMIQ